MADLTTSREHVAEEITEECGATEKVTATALPTVNDYIRVTIPDGEQVAFSATDLRLDRYGYYLDTVEGDGSTIELVYRRSH